MPCVESALNSVHSSEPSTRQATASTLVIVDLVARFISNYALDFGLGDHVVRLRLAAVLEPPCTQTG